MIYKVKVGASKAGSQGGLYYEKRAYEIAITDQLWIWDELVRIAIRRAYNEGLEHVRIENVEPRPFDAP